MALQTDTQSAEPSASPVLRDPSGLWPWFRGFAILYILSIVLLAGFNTAFLQISRGDPNYDPVDPAGLATALGAMGGAVVAGVAFIVCVVLTARLTYRMMRNLHRMGSPHVSIGPRWAVGWYFIPFANLVMPVKAVSEIWRGTFAAVNAAEKEPRGAIGLWWAFWLIGNICDNIAGRLLGGGWFQQPVTPSEESLMAGTILAGAGAIGGAAAALFMLIVFGQLVRGQAQLVRTSEF
jgi:hypothetical protein